MDEFMGNNSPSDQALWWWFMLGLLLRATHSRQRWVCQSDGRSFLTVFPLPKSEMGMGYQHWGRF